MVRKVMMFFGLMVVLTFVLFLIQNSGRPPSLDTQGGYLSLDLYFIGFQLIKPIGVSVLMVSSFFLGMLSCVVYVLLKKPKN